MNKKTTENTAPDKNQINEIWVLTELDGSRFDISSTQKRPTLEVHIAENRVVGNDGCNNFFGPLEKLTDSDIKIGMLAGTKMMCPNIDVSLKFTSALQATSSYHITNMHLHLMDEKGTEVAVLMKVD